MVIISTGLPCSTMWNFSSSVVPPEVNSMSSVALCSLAFCSSQCPTSVFNWAKASALPPAAAIRREPASPATNATAIRIRATFFIASPPNNFVSLQLPWTNRNGVLLACSRGYGRRGSITLRGVPHDESHDAARQNDLGVIMLSRWIRHRGNRECQQRSDYQTEHDSQRYGLHLSGEKPDEEARD